MFKKFFKETIPGDKIIFIVEDNEVYAKSLQLFILSHFPDIVEVKIFSIGEMCLMDMYRNPNIIIMDYFLNSKYDEAHNGMEVIERIKEQKPLTNIILLSSQTDNNIILEAMKQFDCIYVQKDQDAFGKVEQSINMIFNHNNVTPEPWN